MVASGGVAALDDIRACRAAGLAGVIVGKALYEGRIDLAEAIRRGRGPAPLRRSLMPAKRIIPCLDVKNGRVVKGIHFENLRDAGNPVEAASRYDAQGADEVTYLDIAATQENRGTLLALVERTAACVFAPLTVGGGVRSEPEMIALLRAGADKVSVNSAAVKDPGLVDRLSALAGAQALVIAIDVKRRPQGGWEVYVAGGTKPTGVEGVAWAREVASAARASSCSPAWTGTARAPATTSSSSRRCAGRCRSRSSPRAGWARSSTSPRGCASPTRRSPPASSTTGSTR